MTGSDNIDKELDEFEAPGANLSDIPVVFSSRSLPVGLPTLEEAEYFREGQPDLVIIGARPSTGKSAMLCQLAFNLSQHGAVHLFSLEMSAGQLKGRLMALSSGVPVSALKVTPDAVKRANNDLMSRKLRIDDTNGLSINELYSRAVSYHKRHQTKAVFVDYLQIVGSTQGKDKFDQIGHVSKMLKQLAKELNCPVIAAAQLNRNLDGRMASAKNKGDVYPVMSDLAESSKIEAWADVVMLLHRQVVNGMPDPKHLGGYVVKNRHGLVKDFKLEFRGDLYRFIDRGYNAGGI